MPEIETIKIKDKNFPPLLRQITDPPEHLHVRGNISPLLDPTAKVLCVVGSREYSDYGKEVVEKLIGGLKGYNICIVSGLALGIDSIAHRVALDAGLYTASIPGSGLLEKVLHPKTHIKLAREIVEKGGALLSEFRMDQYADQWTFLKRNRLMAGIAHGTLVIKCGLKSGTLVTSKHATGYDRDVAAVPGSIFSAKSEGPHMLIRNGATPVTCIDDLLEFLGFARREGQSKLPLKENPRFHELGSIERTLLQYLEQGPKSRDQLIQLMEIDSKIINMILTTLELDEFVKGEGGLIRIN
jgi:DNA processing protein